MAIKINGTNTTAQPSITGTDTDTGLVYGTDEVSIVTGGTDRVTVTNTGMGIGTSSPTSIGSGFTEVMISGATEGAGLQLQDTDGNVKAGIFTSDNSNTATLRTITNHPLTFRTNNTERLRILPTGGLTFNGDTATANALDDYEEGTWTPTDTTGVTIAVNNAFYTKIGEFVNCEVDITYSTNSTGGNARITLPFAMRNVGHYGNGISGWSANSDGIKVHVGGATAYWMKLETGSVIGNAHLTPADLSAKRIMASFTYRSGA
tara:strand:+ start:457 stop:1242 length:786 start_codon:yes stop_codon:yes gene_type:complete